MQEENEEEIVAWCKNTVEMLKDGAIWGIPRSRTVFRIDKKRKKFILVEGDSQEELDAINYWFGKIGYKAVRIGKPKCSDKE
jgi:hypothetical protein